ncbi:PIG-L family deacetylase [Streptomyces sp. NPDC006660]|uniref:PIG-L family deacetylase n=1 Tax=Streptomyces sp. NPDC006660 TaxID=3156901 RepID=UPI0033ED6EB8
MDPRPPLRSALLSRRGAVAGSALVALLVSGGVFAELAMSDSEGQAGTGGHPVNAGPVSAGPADARPASPPPVRPDGGSVMQIMAHPDDDLFFMNPDTGQSLRSGRPMTSVYVTAGEADGVNSPPVKKGERRPAADRAAYAEARQNGIRGAYAQMATGDRAGSWTRRSIPTAGGGTAELDTLDAHPGIHLVWVQLREAETILGKQPHSLRGLWNGQTGALASQIASGSPAHAFTYTKDQVVKTLAGLMERFRPTHVRTMDPTPGLDGKPGKIIDHQDHIYSARFAQAALQEYARSANHPDFSVQTYFGYNTSHLPHTFPKAAADAKAAVVETYAWMDPDDNYCASAAGCGDRKVAPDPHGNNWAESIRYSRTNSTSWLTSGADGSLWAFGVLNQRLAVWHKPPGANSTWDAPGLLPGDGMDPGVSATRLADGRLAVFGTRTLFGAEPGGYQREAVATVQRPDGTFGPWRSLGAPRTSGAPGAGGTDGVFDMSTPSAAVDGTGKLTVFLRGADRRLHSATLTGDGDWTPWTSLGGAALIGDPVAATDGAGRVHVFSSTPSSMATWVQRDPGAPMPARAEDTGLPPNTTGLSAHADGAGVRVYYRAADSGDVRSVLFTGARPAAPTGLGGTSGYGMVGAAGPLVAGRAASGALATAEPGTDGTRWAADSGILFTGAPSAVADGRGAVAAAIGLDGRLYWTRAAGPGSPAAPWQPASD